MLFINTAIALTFLPAILSAPASADLPSRNGFEDDFAYDFSTDFDDDFENGVELNNFEDDMGFSGRRNGLDYNEYKILVQTGDKLFSGTDSKIFITFGDAYGKTVSTFLSKNNFFDRRLNRNHLGIFKVSTASQLDDICMITIGNDMKGWFSSW